MSSHNTRTTFAGALAARLADLDRRLRCLETRPAPKKAAAEPVPVMHTHPPVRVGPAEHDGGGAPEDPGWPVEPVTVWSAAVATAATRLHVAYTTTGQLELVAIVDDDSTDLEAGAGNHIADVVLPPAQDLPQGPPLRPVRLDATGAGTIRVTAAWTTTSDRGHGDDRAKSPLP